MHPPHVEYAFQKVIDEIRERISQLAPNCQVEEKLSHNAMREDMAYKLTIVNDKNEEEGLVNITMGGVDFNLYGRPEAQRKLLKQEFSAKKFKEKFDVYEKEYSTISKEIYQKARQLPPVKEITKLEPYTERLERALPFNAYLAYATRRMDQRMHAARTI